MMATGALSSIAQLTVYDVDPYDLSTEAGEDKLVDFDGEAGTIDILVELTAPLDYAIEQQTFFLSEIEQYIILVKDRMFLTINSMVLSAVKK